MKRRAFLSTTAAGAAASVGAGSLAVASLVSGRAHAAPPIDPGCFEPYPWDAPFVPAVLDTETVLQTGTWNLIANGRIFTFTVGTVDGTYVDAWMSSGTVENIEWDPVAKRLAFTRVTSDGQGGTTDQDFEGYMMDVNPDDPLIRIAGTLTREPPPITNYDDPSRLTYGFVMTIER